MRLKTKDIVDLAMQAEVSLRTHRMIGYPDDEHNPHIEGYNLDWM